ncbi:hypothetical protein AUC44_12685 [Deinococcus actinosclerus]|uniref:IrrE N-terminal-like domain-containing protein n=1 Tax=Deinococcus actinosclerus TaxID=1768108 RepID=A0ABN4K962_9DEIO|nr:hypothetical protein AUC44_12685 [Deinococcus actinosclerus]
MRTATHVAIQFALNEHQRAEWTTNPERLCWALGIRVIPGRRSSAHAGPPAIITLAREHYAPRQKFTIHHEIAHILIQRAGLEDDILAEVDEDDAHQHLEAVTNYIASLLVMPDVMIRHALDTYGQHPETILLTPFRVGQGCERVWLGRHGDGATATFSSARSESEPRPNQRTPFQCVFAVEGVGLAATPCHTGYYSSVGTRSPGSSTPYHR